MTCIRDCAFQAERSFVPFVHRTADYFMIACAANIIASLVFEEGGIGVSMVYGGIASLAINCTHMAAHRFIGEDQSRWKQGLLMVAIFAEIYFLLPKALTFFQLDLSLSQSLKFGTCAIFSIVVGNQFYHKPV